MATEYPQSSGPRGGGFRPVAPNWPDDASWQPAPQKKRLRTLLISAVIFILVASGISAALVVFLKARGTGDVLAKMTPNNTAFYLSIYLDPPASQKSNFNNLLHRFPDVRDDAQRDKKVNDVIDDALRTSHLNHNDVKSWLGSQLSVIAPDDILGIIRGGAGGGRATAVDTADRGSSGGELPFAILIASTDDKKAQATLDAFRNGGDGQKYTWTDDNHDGVPISRGVPRSSRDGSPIVYSIVNHAAVFSASPSLTNDIIDTAHGKSSSLDSNDRYKKAIAGLPGDHLALAYIDVQAAVSQVRGQLGSGARRGGSTTPPAGLDAFQGLALSLSAQSKGFAIDGAADFDPAKLTEDQRRLLETKSGTNSMLSFVPARAYGFLALTGLNGAANSAVNAFGDLDPEIRRGLEQFGLTGPEGILAHLTGDAAVEVGPRVGTATPGGALLLGTNDEAAMGRFLGKVADLAAQGSGPPESIDAPSPLQPGTAPSPNSVPPPGPASGFPFSNTSGAATPQARLVAVTPQPQAATSPRPYLTPRPIQVSPNAVPRPSRVPVPPPAPASPAPIPPPAPDRSVHHVSTTYGGVVITTAQMNGADARGIVPSYAVSHGVGILATNLDEVKAVIDAQSGSGITSAPAYHSAIDQAQKDNNGIIYVDIASVVSALRDNLKGSDRRDFDKVAPDLEPLKTFLFTSQVSGSRATMRIFLGIG